jgi:hypothetical protein
MHGAKIYYLDFGLLIRLSFSFKYLSFLGGETQRPHRNHQSGPLSGQYCFKLSHLCYKNTINKILVQKEEFLNFLSPSRPFSLSKNFLHQGYEGEGS